MEIKDHTFQIKFFHFSAIFIVSSLGIILYQLIKNEFVFNQLDVDLLDVVFVFIFSFIAALGLNRIKLEVKNVDQREKLMIWLEDYFSKFNGNKIYESENQIVYEAEQNKGLFTQRKKHDYYLVTTSKKSQTFIEGPFSRKPKCIR